jgi:ubiquinone/menaquinone biosynthesis C-methylase UbiE
MHEAIWTKEQAVAFLDDPARLESESPTDLWSRSGLREGMCVVDVGAGSGFFTFPASELVGRSGRVYAVDHSAELVELLRERSRRRHRDNVVPVLSARGRIPLPSAVADRVLLANVLHGISPATIREAVRVLRPGGRLVDHDWKKTATSRGPPVPHRLSLLAARRALERYGLRAVAEWESGPDHYAVMLEKAPASGEPASPRRSRPRVRKNA